MATFSGALTALITPFRNDVVDERALRDLVEDQVTQGMDGLVPCGTTGESVNLSDAEYEKVVRVVVEQAKGRVPVVAGAGTASTRHTVELCHLAQRAGADGVLIVTPYYNRPSQDGLVAHFEAVAKDGGLPVVLYNIPGRTGVDLSLASLERLARLKEVVGIKECAGAPRAAEIVARFGDRFTLLSGDDVLTLPLLALGGHGVISVASNIVPGEVARLLRLFREGDIAGAAQQAKRLHPLYEALFLESSPGPAKAALVLCGRIAPEIRLPMVLPAQGAPCMARLRSALQSLGVL